MIDTVQQIIQIVMLVWSIITFYYLITLLKRQRKYRQEIDAYGLDNPDEIVSEEEVKKKFQEINKVYVEPYKTFALLMIVQLFLSVLMFVMRYFRS